MVDISRVWDEARKAGGRVKNAAVHGGRAAGGAGGRAGRRAYDEATATTRRKFIAGAGGAVLGAGIVDEVATGGEVRGTIADTAGNWWEEIIEDPLGQEIDDLPEWNTRTNEFLNNFNERYTQELRSIGEERGVELPLILSNGAEFQGGRYQLFGFRDEQLPDPDMGEIGATYNYSSQEGDWIALTDDAYALDNVISPNEYDWFSLAIAEDDSRFLKRELREIEEGYREMAEVASNTRGGIQTLMNTGHDLRRNAKEYEDEEEMRSYREAGDKLEQLDQKFNQTVNDEARFRDYADFFQTIRQDAAYESGQWIGEPWESTTATPDGTETPTGTPTATPTETPGEQPLYEQCALTEDQSDALYAWASDRGASLDDLDYELHSKNGEFQLEFSYDGETASIDDIDNC